MLVLGAVVGDNVGCADNNIYLHQGTSQISALAEKRTENVYNSFIDYAPCKGHTTKIRKSLIDLCWTRFLSRSFHSQEVGPTESASDKKIPAT